MSNVERLPVRSKSHQPAERERIQAVLVDLAYLRETAPPMAQSAMTYDQAELFVELGTWATSYAHAVAVKTAKQSGKSVAKKAGLLEDGSI